MNNIDLKKLSNIEIKKETIIPIASISIAFILVLIFMLTSPQVEEPTPPLPVPLGKAKFKKNPVVFTDNLPKPKKSRP